MELLRGNSSDSRYAIVMGGSLGGLNAALWLRQAGFEVSVFERSAKSLFGRGAGIVLHPATVQIFKELDQQQQQPHGNDTNSSKSFNIDEVSLLVDTFLLMGGMLREDGTKEQDETHPISIRLTSYNSLLSTYRSHLGENRYCLNHQIISIKQDAEKVTVKTKDGQSHTCDLLVCADGSTSEARKMLNVQSEINFSGYFAWRGIIPESKLSRSLSDRFGKVAVYYLLEDSHVICYPIPFFEPDDENGSKGKQVTYFNWLWYRNLPADHDDLFCDLMTDTNGMLRSRSVPAGYVKEKYISQLRKESQEQLPSDFYELINATDNPFVQAVYDVSIEQMAHGRVCFLGDSAFTPRPHIAVATAKAAEDARLLAKHLGNTNHGVVSALKEWQKTQLKLGRDCVRRGQLLGEKLQSVSRDKKQHITFGLYKPNDSSMS